MHIESSELPALVRTVVAQTLATPLYQQPQRIAYTIAEAAELVGLPRTTLRDRVASGEIPARKRCGKWLILRADLMKWLADS